MLYVFLQALITLNPDKIVGFKWIDGPFEDSCINKIIFSNNNTFTIDNNCEIKDSTFGKWDIENSILIIEEIGSFYTYNFNDKKFIELDKMKWEAKYENDIIKFIYAYRFKPSEMQFSKIPISLDGKLNSFRKLR